MANTLILGIATMIGCMAIQCVIVSIMLRALLVLGRRKLIRATLIGTTTLLTGIMLVMLAGNLGQITIWAWVFLARGEFADLGTAFYHSVVNFTTLGYGDLVMSEGERLLGALEAANGIMMFGLTTAFLFAILNELATLAWDENVDEGVDPAEPASR